MKKIYLIEAKLSIEKLERLREILEKQEQDFTRVESCTRADYIVTELKSPSRIIKNARRSTCPVVHISWLLESIRQGRQLSPDDYLIDVSEARKQEAIDLANCVPLRALPNQLTWDQVAVRRKANSTSSSIYGGVQERRRFQYAYGSRNKSLKTGTPSLGHSAKRNPLSTALGNLENEINHLATTVSSSPAKEINTTTPPSSKLTPPTTARTIKETIKAAPPLVSTSNKPASLSDSVHSSENIKSTTVVALVAESSNKTAEEKNTADDTSICQENTENTFEPNITAEVDSYSLSALDRLRQKLFITTSTPFQASIKNHTIAITRMNRSPKRKYDDDIEPAKSESSTTTLGNSDRQDQRGICILEGGEDIDRHKDSGMVSAPVLNEEDLKSVKRVSSNGGTHDEPANKIVDPDFSVTATKKQASLSSNCPHTANEESGAAFTTATVDKNRNYTCRCSVEQITRSLSLSSVDDTAKVAEATNLHHTCSSASSSDFDPNQYSLSAILSL